MPETDKDILTKHSFSNRQLMALAFALVSATFTLTMTYAEFVLRGEKHKALEATHQKDIAELKESILLNHDANHGRITRVKQDLVKRIVKLEELNSDY